MQEYNSQNGGQEIEQPQGSPHVVDLRLLYQEPANKVPLAAKIKANFSFLFHRTPKPLNQVIATVPKESTNSRPLFSYLSEPLKFIFSFYAGLFRRIFRKPKFLSLQGLLNLAQRILSLIGWPFVYGWFALSSLSAMIISAFVHLFSFARNAYAKAAWLLKLAKIKAKIRYIRLFTRQSVPKRLKREARAVSQLAVVVEKSFVESFSDFKLDLRQEAKEFKQETESAWALKFRPLAGFVVVLFVLILPFKGFSYFESLDDLRVQVLTSSTAAVKELFSAGQSAGKLDLKAAGSNFSEASKQFATAEAQLGEINSLLFDLAKLLPNKEAKLAGYSKTVVEAGKLLSDVGLHLTKAVDGVISGGAQGIGVSLNNFTDEGDQALAKAQKLSELLETINTDDVPAKYKATFIELKDKAKLFNGSLASLVQAVDKLKVFAGMERDTRYLLVFQNNAEMRASGGFFGSYALLDFSRGKIKNLEVPAGGTYDVEAGYHDRIIAPTPLQMVNPLWHLWDANWWYDWPTTAKKLSWFYEKSGGPTVDGVISLTPTVIEDFLRAYGPVDMTKDYGVVITPENFWQVTQEFSEQKPDVTTKPKRIIGDMFQAIIADFPNRLNKPTLLKLVLGIEKSFNEKQALLYFKNEDLAKWVASYGWDGQAKQTSQDYLAVINSSVGGGKSDREITQRINHSATVLADGSVIDEVEIIRTHPVSRGAQFTGVRNVDWLRVYVPQGSELIEASGFRAPDQKYFEKPDPSWTFDESLAAEDKNFQVDQQSGTKIYQEFGKSVFANWTMVDPGETVRLYFKYKLPFRATKQIASEWPVQVADLFGLKGTEIVSYGLLAQKQPGSLNTTLQSSLNIGPYYRASRAQEVWHYPKEPEMKTSDQGWSVELPFLTDQYFATLFEKK
jgi:hypothetical protein